MFVPKSAALSNPSGTLDLIDVATSEFFKFSPYSKRPSIKLSSLAFWITGSLSLIG